MRHSHHNMQVNSLLCYFASYTDDEFNQKFRNDTRVRIIHLLQEHPDGLTDSEMAKLIGCYPNQNINRPRRNDLSNPTGKFKIIEDSGESRINELGNRETVWVLSREKLYYFMRSD